MIVVSPTKPSNWMNDNDGTLEDIGVDLYSYLSIVENLVRL